MRSFIQVRRTLASSIHELGVILGEEVASKDLVPIFNGFIKVRACDLCECV